MVAIERFGAPQGRAVLCDSKEWVVLLALAKVMV